MTTPLRHSLVDGDVYSSLKRMAIPSALGMIAMILVNVIDAFWVSRIGTDALAAMAFTFPIIGVVINISLGITIGTSTAIARALGQGDDGRASKITTHALLLGIVVVIVIVTLGLNVQDFLYRGMGAKAELLPLIRAYMDIWFWGMIALILPLIANGVFRAAGDAKTPMYLMMAVAVINGILDPILIFGVGEWIPAMGIEGAAYATVIARVFGMGVAVRNLVTRTDLLRFELPSASDFIDSVRSILSVGLPAAATNVLGPLSVAAVTTIVAKHGVDALGAYGLGAQLDGLILIVPLAVSGALSPFVGQNWGARLRRRVSSAIGICLKIVMVWGLVCAFVVGVAAPWIASAFTDDDKLLPSLIQYLRIVPWGYAFIGFVGIASSAFNAVDQPLRSTWLSILRSFVFAVPAAYLGGQWFGLPGVFGGLVLASSFAAALGYAWLHFLLFPTGKAPKRVLDAVGATRVLQPHLHDLDLSDLWPKLMMLEDLTLQRLDGRRVGFFVGQRQLGHMHEHGRIDVPLPNEIGDNLVNFGMLERHSPDEYDCWYSLSPKTDVFATSALWLIRLSHLLYEMSERGENDVVTQQEIKDFVVSDQCLEAMRASIDRWRLRYVPA